MFKHKIEVFLFPGLIIELSSRLNRRKSSRLQFTPPKLNRFNSRNRFALGNILFCDCLLCVCAMRTPYILISVKISVRWFTMRSNWGTSWKSNKGKHFIYWQLWTFFLYICIRFVWYVFVWIFNTHTLVCWL